MAYFTVSENVAVCCNVPDAAVTVTVDVTGVLLEEPPPGQRLRTTRTNPGLHDSQNTTLSLKMP
jgi:hypothetical protein